MFHRLSIVACLMVSIVVLSILLMQTSGAQVNQTKKDDAVTIDGAKIKAIQVAWDYIVGKNPKADLTMPMNQLESYDVTIKSEEENYIVRLSGKVIIKYKDKDHFTSKQLGDDLTFTVRKSDYKVLEVVKHF